MVPLNEISMELLFNFWEYNMLVSFSLFCLFVLFYFIIVWVSYLFSICFVFYFYIWFFFFFVIYFLLKVTVKCVYVKISDMHRISLSSVLLFFVCHVLYYFRLEWLLIAFFFIQVPCHLAWVACLPWQLKITSSRILRIYQIEN
jgi:hypothetical protein